MSKTRFTSMDVKAMVRDLRASIMGQRLANIYDVDDKTYLFKFAVKDEVGESEKIMLLIESGIRFHTTKFQRQKNEIPSPFAMKLRKFVRTKKIEDIKQIGLDRVVDIRFGSGETAMHILLEFYANGNLILTDANYEVIALLRSHQFDAEVALKIGEVYPIRYSTNIESTGDEGGGQDSSNSPNRNSEDATGIQSGNVDFFSVWAMKHDAENDTWQQSAAAGPKAKRGAKKMNLRQLLLCKDSTVGHFGPEILDHIILTAGLLPSTKIQQALLEVAALGVLMEGLRGAGGLLASLNTPHQPGYILTQASSSGAVEPSEVEFSEFSSFLLRQHKGRTFITFPTFGDAVDAYFFRLEAAKASKAQRAAEEAALKKLQKVRNEAENHVKKLEKTQESMQRAAQIVTKYADEIDKCVMVLNSCLENCMEWTDIEDMVAFEARQGNPIASLVKRLRLDKGRVVLQLPSADSDSDSDSDSDEDENAQYGEKQVRPAKPAPATIDVDIDLSLSAHANARNLFTYKKAATQKQLQTVESSSRAVAAVELSTLKTIAAQKIKQTLREVRKVHWFEKFHWFVTSDGHLVLSGKDAQQNELLVKKYLRTGDVYVHAEIHGAASCVVRAKDPTTSNAGESAPSDATAMSISPSALQEAGQVCICRSYAWTVKQIASAYWVHAEQVSKSAPSGEYLSTGSLMIRGKKNFLPPLMLEMGFGVMFRLDDQSVARHTKQRASRAGLDSEGESYVSMLDRYGLDDETNDDDVEDQSAGVFHDTIDENVDEEGSEGGNVEEDGVENEKDACAEEEEDGDEDEECSWSDEEENVHSKTSARDARRKVVPAPLPPSKLASLAKPPPAPVHHKRGRPISKKKARRYAEQDEEEKRLSLLALGHKPAAAAGEKGSERSGSQSQAAKDRRDKAGVGLLGGAGPSSWMHAMDALPAGVRDALEDLLQSVPPRLSERDIGLEELIALSSFKEAAGIEIVALFSGEDGVNLTKKGNKSAFLAGVMRRYAKDHPDGKPASVSSLGDSKTSKKVSKEESGVSELSTEKAEVQSILEEEGILDEEEGKAADEHEKLSGFLLPDDVFLYCVPVCGPYSALRNFKYKVKLTPGTLKKGKACKTAVEAWVRQKECGERERGMIRGMSDPECVAVLIGDVRVSMPGLHGSGTAKDAKRAKQRGQKSLNKNEFLKR